MGVKKIVGKIIKWIIIKKLAEDDLKELYDWGVKKLRELKDKWDER